MSATAEYISTVRRREDSSCAERRILSGQDAVEEALFTGLRLNAGIDLAVDRDRNTASTSGAQFGGELQPFVEQGLLIYDGGALRLTRAGMLLAHEIMTVFIRSPVR